VVNLANQLTYGILACGVTNMVINKFLYY